MNICQVATLLYLLTSPLSGQTVLYYESNTSNKTVSTHWSITEQGQALAIIGLSSDKSSTTLTTQLNYSLDAFEQKDPGKEYELSAKREGGLLSVTGLVKQVKKTKNYQIDDKPWIQEFAFGFKDFLSSTDREYKFEILQPQSLDLHDMIATKEEIEEVRIDDKVYQAQKLKITLQGFRKRFWKAEAWYDVETKNLVRYKANEGPGTPITDMILLEPRKT